MKTITVSMLFLLILLFALFYHPEKHLLSVLKPYSNAFQLVSSHYDFEICVEKNNEDISTNSQSVFRNDFNNETKQLNPVINPIQLIPFISLHLRI